MQVAPDAGERDGLVNDAAMTALARFDDTMRNLALQRYREFERELGPVLTRFVVAETMRRFQTAGDLRWPAGVDADKETTALVEQLVPRYGKWLAAYPALENVTRITQKVAERLAELEALTVEPSAALAVKESPLREGLAQIAGVLGAQRPTFAGAVHAALTARRLELWRERVAAKINWELFDRGVETFTWAALVEVGKSARKRGLLDGAAYGSACDRFIDEAARADKGVVPDDREVCKSFAALRQEIERPFAATLFLWRRVGGPKGDLRQELDTVMQVPGWINVWTQPIANRIDMLGTGVKSQVGVRVFGPDLPTIDRVCREIEQALKPITGAQDVIAEPIMGEGYLEITIDRPQAARYGLSVGDIQDTIEVALGGKVITYTVEGRDRFPVRVRYARDFREDEEQVKRLLVGRMAGLPAAMPAGGATAFGAPGVDRQHVTTPEHGTGAGPVQIPLGKVAKVHIVEGPTMVKSENGRLRNYVTLNVSGARHRRLRRGSAAGGGRKGAAAGRRPHRMGRRVRTPGPRRADLASDLPGSDRADLRDPVPYL